MSKAKRILLGLATVVAIGVVSELLAPAGGGPSSFIASSGLGLFLACIAGGYVARSGFLVPALLLSLAGWSIAVFAAWQIAEAAQGIRFLDVVSNNLGGLLRYSVAAMAGAAAGMWLYAFRSSLWLLDH